MITYLKTSWTILRNVIILFIFLELILSGFYNYKAGKEYQDFLTLKIENSVHKNMTAEEVKAMYYEYIDTEMEWTPYVHYKPKEYSGIYNNINENGLRKTKQHDGTNSSDTVKIFCFGGSTMYGIGASDNTTIPSLLSDILAKKHPNKNFEVTNYGVLGYNRDQEAIQIRNEILKNNIPDIAIFFDGVNEVFASHQNKKVGMPTNTVNRHLEFNSKKSYWKRASLFYEASYTKKLIKYIQHKTMPAKPIVHSNELANKVAINYVRQILLSESTMKHYHITAINILQPTIFTKKELSPFEVIMKTNENYVKDLYDKTYDAIQKDTLLSKIKSYVDLTAIFNHTPETVYTDFCHTTEKGNTIIAEAMYEQIKYKLIQSALPDSTKIESK